MADAHTTPVAPAELEARDAAAGARLLVAGDAFLFLGFLFAYFYLRALNSNGRWNPAGEDPSTALGTVSLLVALASAAVLAVAVQRQRSSAAGFRAPAAAALGLALVFTLLQGWQLFAPGFSPNHAGGMGSVFIGFTAVLVVHLLGALYWLETLVAQREPPTRAATAAFALFWGFLVAVFAVFFLLFYVVI